MTNLPHRHQVDFAKRKGSVPYPCFYCAYRVITNEEITDEHNIVKEFGYDVQEGYDPIPQTCMMGQRGPTDYADCKHILPVALQGEYKRWYPSSLFGFFTKEYMIEIITDINCQNYIPRKMLVGRAFKGYHTREQRIEELLKDGIIDRSYDVNCNECYSLTDYGQQIADVLCNMLDQYNLIRQHGELMRNETARLVFEFIRSHSDCVAKQVYDYFTEVNPEMPETEVPMTLESLVMAGYVEPTYNDDFTRISYNVTQKGILRWRALYVDADMQ